MREMASESYISQILTAIGRHFPKQCMEKASQTFSTGHYASYKSHFVEPNMVYLTFQSPKQTSKAAITVPQEFWPRQAFPRTKLLKRGPYRNVPEYTLFWRMVYWSTTWTGSPCQHPNTGLVVLHCRKLDWKYATALQRRKPHVSAPGTYRLGIGTHRLDIGTCGLAIGTYRLAIGTYRLGIGTDCVWIGPSLKGPLQASSCVDGRTQGRRWRMEKAWLDNGSGHVTALRGTVAWAPLPKHLEGSGRSGGSAMNRKTATTLGNDQQ